MFQMSKQLFEQCWPLIAAQIEDEKASPGAKSGMASRPSPSSAAEAGYVLGVAIGYAMQIENTRGAPLSISVPGWRADACGSLNWPQIVPSRMPPGLGSRPA